MSHQANIHKEDNTMNGKKILVDNAVFFFSFVFFLGEGSAERVVLRDFMLADISLTNTPKE